MTSVLKAYINNQGNRKSATYMCVRRSTFENMVLDVQLLRLFGPLHDELEPRGRILAHELVDHAIGDDLIGDLHAQQTPRPRIERRLPQHLRHHLPEAFEARDLRLRTAADALEDVLLVLLV